MRVSQPRERRNDGLDQLDGLQWNGATVLSQHPSGEKVHVGEVRLEDPVFDVPCIRQRALDPPRGVVGDRNARPPDDLPDLPRPWDSMLLDVEVRRDPEVTLPARREPDVATDARDLERAGRPAIQVVTHDVPVALVEAQRIRVHRSLAGPGAAGAPVPEADRALLRDRGLELGETTGELRRVVRDADSHALGGVRRWLGEARAPEGKVLQCEAERLRVRELALEVVERGLERGELVVVEVESLEEVVLGPQRVELLAGELVSLRLQRHPERGQLRSVRVEAARERLVRHLAVALDVRLDVTGRQEASLGHEEGHERELPDQLVGVVGH